MLPRIRIRRVVAYLALLCCALHAFVWWCSTRMPMRHALGFTQIALSHGWVSIESIDDPSKDARPEWVMWRYPPSQDWGLDWPLRGSTIVNAMYEPSDVEAACVRMAATRRSFPLWMSQAVLIAATILLNRRASRRPPPGHCAACGYNLTGNVSGMCPECGTEFNPRGSQAVHCISEPRP